MRSVLSHAERDRRWTAVSDAMVDANLDVMVIVANDYNGHRGGLRYMADFHLAAFYSYVVLPRGGEVTVILPMASEGCHRSDWVDDYRFASNMMGTLVDVLNEVPSMDRIGVVGISQIMRVEDYLHLTSSFGGSEIVDASVVFESVRAHKSPEEVAGLEEAMYIADQCLKQLLDVARPGVTTRQLRAEALRTNALLGGNDPIFLTMDGTVRDGKSLVRWAQVSDDLVSPSGLFTFSFEMIGPSGYWVELSRMIAFAPPTPEESRIHEAVKAGMDTAVEQLKPGAAPEDVQSAMLASIAEHGARSAYWLGHGIGQDVIEAPWLGREVIQADDATRSTTFSVSERMAFAVHPFLLSESTPGLAGYMADTVVVEESGARRLSRYPLDLIHAF